MRDSPPLSRTNPEIPLGILAADAAGLHGSGHSLGTSQFSGLQQCTGVPLESLLILWSAGGMVLCLRSPDQTGWDLGQRFLHLRPASVCCNRMLAAFYVCLVCCHISPVLRRKDALTEGIHMDPRSVSIPETTVSDL